MKHRVAGRRLDRTTEHRTAMFRNMVTSLLRHERIETTTPKAKELKRIADKVITLGKRGSPHDRREAYRQVRDVEVLNKLFESLGPRFASRPGGYTRVVKLRRRPGDNAEISLIELTEQAPAEEAGGKGKPEKAARAEKAEAGKKAPAEKPPAGKKAAAEKKPRAEEKPKAQKKAKKEKE
ncbi:MAG TPA: 50S ribosomal protein L17 [Anaeromyxobacteraceae bacterium]|nr:50S ribosomal protein L17 [Anaeromyxobacteraceae bacterium]